MEQFESGERNEQKKGKFECKEYIEPRQVQAVLNDWLQALMGNSDLQVSVKGQNFTIPSHVLQNTKVKFEYEIKNGEYELELEMKWRQDGQNSGNRLS